MMVMEGRNSVSARINFQSHSVKPIKKIRSRHSKKSGQLKQSFSLFIITILLSLSIAAAVDNTTTVNILPDLNFTPENQSNDLFDQTVNNESQNGSLDEVILDIIVSNESESQESNQTDNSTIETIENKTINQTLEQEELLTQNNTSEINATSQETNGSGNISIGTIYGFEANEYFLTTINENEFTTSYELVISKQGSSNSGVSIATVEEVQSIQIGLQGVTSDITKAQTAIVSESFNFPNDYGLRTDILAMDNIELESATITLPIDTAVSIDAILHCEDFNMNTNQCESSWEQSNIKFTQTNNQIEFTVTHFSAYAGAEIVATDAQHLDINKIFIQNIYTQIATKDDRLWSPPIYNNEYVRVTFEQPLTSENTIDFVARSNGTIAYVEIYDINTSDLIATSAVIDIQEHQYLLAEGITTPQDTFDFKIIAVEEDLTERTICQDNCQDECSVAALGFGVDQSECLSECESSCLLRPAYNHSIDSTNTNLSEVFVEFDFIHDAAYNSSAADGIIIYAENTQNAPRYRLWDSTTNDFGAEQTDMTDLGGDTKWVLAIPAPTRDEILIGTQDDQNDQNIRVYNGSAFTNLLEISTDSPNAAYRSFDIAYERSSGDALIVYESSGTADSDYSYRTWDGSSYSIEQTLTTPLSGGAYNWVQLYPKEGSNEVMLLLHSNSGNLYAVPWNGTNFDTTYELTLSTGTTSSNEQHFGFAWEQSSGQGIVVYGETDLTYRTYDPVGGFGGVENTISTGAIDGVRLCSEPAGGGDYVGIIWQDSGNDVNVRMWDGSSILASPPSEDARTEPNGANNVNVDCVWYNSSTALFGFIDNGGLGIDYITFEKSNTWSSSDLTTTSTSANFASDDIQGLRFIKHPSTDEFMAVAFDIVEDLTTIRWTGTTFTAPTTSLLESSTEATNAAQEGAYFSWFAYDSAPTITDVNPQADSFSQSNPVDINATITDNIQVSQVFVNITYPNGTIEQYEMLNTSETQYNYTFTQTDLGGAYSFQIIANDSNNYQSTSSNTFSISEGSNPLVTNLIPTIDSIFNLTNQIEVAATVTDSGGVSTVIANITFPNSTIEQLTLTDAGSDKYNNSFVIPSNLPGDYNITIIANDSNNNINSSETSNFTANDILAPSILDLIPSISTNYNISNMIEIAANLSDDVSVSDVSVNITFPNATIENYELTFDTNSRYNTTFTAPANIGTYTVLFIANDTSNNLNTTNSTTFVVVDTINPTVTNIVPTEDSEYNLTNVIEINATVTDNIEISQVFANISYPNGTIEQLELGLNSTNLYNASFTIPSDLIGTYNITYIANDSSNNINSSQTSNFTVNDITIPNVSIVSCQPPNINVSQSIECNATISDNIALSQVIANVTLPNGTQEIQTTENVGSEYNFTFTPDNVTGTYTVGWWANDSSNNIYSNTTTFTSSDVSEPSVTNLVPSQDTQFNVSTTIDINASITDDVSISQAFANVTYPNGTLEQYELTNTVSNIFNTEFSILTLIGTYNVTFITNDSSNNQNTTQTTNFTVIDSINPSITIVTPLEGASISSSESIAISSLITDNVELQSTQANISFPNGTVETLNLADQGSDVYGSTFTRTQTAGQYEILILANDTSSNQNNSETRNFTVADNVVPIVNLVTPLDDLVTSSNSITFTCNATDNLGLANVSLYHNISGPFELNQTNTTVEGTSNQTEFTINSIDDGNYLWNCEATDTDANPSFASQNRTVTIDTTSPTTSSPIPSNDTSYNLSNTISMSIAATDVVGISQAFANISFPNGTIEQVELASQGSNIYNTTFTLPSDLIGDYNITFVVNDTAGNYNVAQNSNFSLYDVSAPSFENLIPTNNSVFNITTVFEINATVSDNIAVSQVFANITYPNGTIEQVELGLNETNLYNNTFTVPNLVGEYLITYIANDSSNNQNTTQTTNFNVTDNTVPSASGPSPNNGTTANVNQSISLGINATDSVEISQVFVNLTLPNGTIEQQELSLQSSPLYNNSYTLPLLPGNYTLLYIVNDTSGNLNASNSIQLEVLDQINPLAFGEIPITGSLVNVSDQIEIAINTTDNVQISAAIANVTFSNGTTEQVTLSNSEDNKYNSSFTIPNLLGQYNITFIINDSSNNVNNTQTTNLIASESTSPTLAELVCTPNQLNISGQTECNATITDNFELDTVISNVTLPNGTTQILTNSNESSLYNFTFTQTTLVGNYTVTWWANDTSGNTQNESETFYVNDTTSPSITLNGPINNSNYSTRSVQFNITTIDNYYTTQNCSIFLDGSLNTTNSAVANNTLTTFTIGQITEGFHSWNALCVDSSSNSNQSQSLNFTIDLSEPTFTSLNVSPNNEIDLDPQVNLTFTANVSDNFTAVDTVILEYKLSNETNYTLNTTMEFESIDIYNTTLNLTENGTYNLRLWSNDTVGNNNISNEINVSVQYDVNWTISPTTFTPVAAVSGQNTSLGNLTINNTGDFALNFTLNASRNTTYYNQSENFSLAAGEVMVIQINDTAPTSSTQETIITVKSYLNGSENSSIAPIPAPSFQDVTGTLVVAQGQPVLTSTFTTPGSDSITVLQGQTSVAFIGDIENIGEADAFNLTLDLELPTNENWSITFGEQSRFIEELGTGDTEEIGIELTIPEDQTAGTYTVYLNVTAVNGSGTNLTSESLTFTDSVQITVQDQTAELGTVSSSGGGGGGSSGSSSSSTSTSAGGGGGGGSGGGSTRSQVVTEEQIVNVKQGKSTLVPVIITNPSTNTVLSDLRISTDGFLSQYVTVTPSFIDEVAAVSDGTVMVSIDVPSYVAVGTYQFRVLVEGFETTQRENKVDIKTSYLEQHTFIVRVEAVSEEEVALNLDDVHGMIDELQEKGINTIGLANTLELANNAINNEDFTLAQEYVDQIKQGYKTANEVLEQIALVQGLTQGANEIDGLATTQTNEALILAQLSLEQGDFTKALERSKNAELMFYLETKGKINLYKFILNYWWIILVILAALSILTYISYRRLLVFIITQRLSNLSKEEITIRRLMVEAQKEFVDGKISENQYKNYQRQYKKRLAKIKQIRTKLTHKRTAALSSSKKLMSLKNEHRDLTEGLKKAQKEFFILKIVDKATYLEHESHFKERLTEVEHEISVIKATNKKAVEKYNQSSKKKQVKKNKTTSNSNKKLKVRKSKVKTPWIKLLLIALITLVIVAGITTIVLLLFKEQIDNYLSYAISSIQWFIMYYWPMVINWFLTQELIEQIAIVVIPIAVIILFVFAKKYDLNQTKRQKGSKK